MDSQSAKPEISLVKQIDDDSVKFLAAGEKINDIETAIRELIENAIDANATNIEVRLSKFGSSAIEVDDNGTGIDEENFEHLGTRYYTSKISDFKNLQESLGTYGFRGEALSCLRTIAQVVIMTKTKTSPTGWKLTFQKDGSLDKERIGRDKGTTVIIKNLFYSLPVRRRELETNAKKHYDKIVKLLYEQILARPQIKFSLCKKNVARKEKDFTHGGSTLETCLITIYGVKLLDSLIPIRQAGLEDVIAMSNTKANRMDTSSDIESSATSDMQQVQVNSDTKTHDTTVTKISTNNAAPVDTHLDTSKVISTRTRSQLKQSSDVSLVSTETSNVKTTETSETEEKDVTNTIEQSVDPIAEESLQQRPGDQFTQSIAPNRDEIFFKRSRKSRFARERPIYTIHGYISQIGKGRNSTDCQYLFVNQKPCDIPKLSRCINELYKSYNQSNQYPFYCLFVQVQRWATDFNVPRKRGVILQDEGKLCDLVRDSLERMYSSFAPASQKSCPIAQIPFASIATTSTKNEKTANETKHHLACQSDQGGLHELTSKTTSANHAVLQSSAPPKPPRPIPIHRDRADGGPEIIDNSRGGQKNGLLTLCSDVADSIPDLFESAPKRARTSGPGISTMRPPQKNTTYNNNSATGCQLPGFQNGLSLFIEEVTASNQGDGCGITNISKTAQPYTSHAATFRSQKIAQCLTRQKQSSPQRQTDPPPEPTCKFEQLEISQNDDLKVKIDFAEDLPAALERERLQRFLPADKKEFSFAIHPKFNAPAEEELKFHLNKTSFNGMQVIGQFNRGFIIARLNKHLFIIDQHATDERANFEAQLENNPLVKQAMVHPRPLYLSLVQENAILNNMDAFVKRGFEFLVDKSKMVGYRVMLSSTSICRGADRDEHLGKEDVEELVDVAVESPNRLESYTLSKVKNVSASIACRMSVMIGDKLTWQQMERIVARMSSLKNPWVCAHNRPTIRHLMDVDWMDK